MAPGRRLLLTRPRQQAGAWAESLAAFGVEVRLLPLIEIAAAADPAEARQAWAELPQAALAMFVSPNAVAGFFAARPPGAGWPSQALAATVGPGSARALLDAGVPPAQIVQPAADAASLDSEHLWPQLASLDWQGRLALILRGEGGRDWLGQRLLERGAEVRYRSVYQRRCAQLVAAEAEVLAEALARPQAHAWLFSSSEAVDCLQQRLAPQADWAYSLCVATHARIAARAEALGFGHVVLARPQPQAVAEALLALQT
ncbi:MAG: uroporphyrinogen-III synthase [Methylibium sp.]|nr:uroporphyrinogen-III synthase [Methylibium sp.]